MLLILASSPTIQGSVLVPNLLLLGSTSWIQGLWVWMQFFLAIIHTLNLLNLFPSMFLALSCFQHVFSLDPCFFMLTHILFVPIYVLYALCNMFVPRSIFSMCCLARSTFFYARSHVSCLDLHVCALHHVFPCFVLPFALC